MNFYEHTIVAKQNLSQKDIDNIEKKYEELIYKNSGSSKEIVKEFGLPYEEISEVPEKLNFIIKNYHHYKKLLMNYVCKEAYLEYEKIIHSLVK